MTDRYDSFDWNHALRERAESLIAELALPEVAGGADHHLLREMRLHQIELEMQNIELREVQSALEDARDQFRELFEFAPVVYLVLNPQGDIVQFNQRAMKLFALNSGPRSKRFVELVADNERGRWQRLFQQFLNEHDETDESLELEMLRIDGASFSAALHYHRRVSLHGSTELRLTINDISKQKQEASELKVAAAAFDSGVGMYITDANGSIVEINEAFTAITGYSKADVLGKNPRIFQSGRHGSRFYQALWHSLAITGRWQGEIWNKRKNGDVHAEFVSVISVKDERNTVTHYVATIVDRTDAVLAEQEIQQLSYFDTITGLPNRNLLQAKLCQTIDAGPLDRGGRALLLIDLDNFKYLNDTRGYNVGDLLLKAVAERLSQTVREADIVAHLGGDKFVLLLTELSAQDGDAVAQAERVAATVWQSFDRPFKLGNWLFSCTASIGVTLIGEDVVAASDVLKQAEIAMYKAKALGKNNVCFFNSLLQRGVNARTELELDLRNAIPEQLRLYYQAQTTQNGKLVGMEVLLRWQHPDKGLLLPNEFLSIAEDAGLIIPIQQWVLTQVCKQLSLWTTVPAARQLKIAVNISPKQFHEAGFESFLTSQLQRYHVSPACLELELGESVLHHHTAHMLEKMQALRKLGVRMTFTNVGTSISSQVYLRGLPWDAIKFERNFLHDSLINPNECITLLNLIASANERGLTIAADGVETEAQRDLLANMGCKYYQGHLFGKPMPMDEMTRLVALARQTDW